MYKIVVLILILLSIAVSCKYHKNITTSNNNPILHTTYLLDKPYNKVCFLMTHNAMNNRENGFWLPNQSHNITRQLQNGVRGLMIDTYDGKKNRAKTYHGVAIAGSQKLVDVLAEVEYFLSKNKNEIITIIFENNGSNTQLIKAIEDAKLEQYIYIHDGQWKTLKEMLNANQRLVLFVESNKEPSKNYLHHAWSIIFDTQYTFKNTNQFNCAVNRGTNTGENKLYLVNHWLHSKISLPKKSLAKKSNNKVELAKRLHECSSTNHHFINFLGVDFYHIGDAKAIVDSINLAN